MTSGKKTEAHVVVGEGVLSIEDLVLIARRDRGIRLNPDPVWKERIQEGARFLDQMVRSGRPIYGVNTGYGESCQTTVPADQIEELPAQLTRFHGCGLGRILDEEKTRAVLVARLVSLVQGASGVRLELLERLKDLLHHNILPRIPEEGSVGASGDLTPLSYIAGVLAGERSVLFEGEVCTAAEALEQCGLRPLRLLPKEALALMNGTSMMTGLACLAFRRARYLLELGSRITALAVLGKAGNRQHFHPRLFELKPHPGQAEVATWLRSDLGNPTDLGTVTPGRLQDSYALRCAPHILGVLADALPWMRKTLEIELNSANDNPLIDVASESILHGGNFYGGHVAFAMDCLKTAVANVADLLDRQVILLLSRNTNRGLRENLTGCTQERLPINHGFKAVGIGTSAWAAEALKGTMPASVFSRSTENHNQDKVSMGTIAARDCLRVIELTEQVAVATLLVTLQAVDLRLEAGELDESALPPGITLMRQQVRERSPMLREDRELDGDLLRLLVDLRAERWELYSREAV